MQARIRIIFAKSRLCSSIPLYDAGDDEAILTINIYKRVYTRAPN